MKKIILLSILIINIGFNIKTLASDNVLQAIQISGVNDSYSIVLKSDDIAEIKKTVQAPNKLMILLKGIRASKTINTIYSNTATVDSVVVEPIDDETVKILIQAVNVSNAQIHFDSLKTPLGVLNRETKSSQSSDKGKEILLSAPINTYRPVYERESEDSDEDIFVSGSESLSYLAKKVFDGDISNWLTTLGLLIILVASGVKMLKRKENNIKIGLSGHQSLQQREIDLYRNLNKEMQNTMAQTGLVQPQAQNSQPAVNYGLRAYQNSTKSPYTTPEMKAPYARIKTPTPQTQPQKTIQPNIRMQKNVSGQVPNALQKAAQDIIKRNNAQVTNKNILSNAAASKTVTKPASINASAPKSASIDSMKFLESMTKIYEKNGNTDLAQNLKNNLIKAKANIA